MSAPRFALRAARPWLLAGVAIIVAIWARVHHSARKELALGVAAEAAGELTDALTHYQYAMRWYSPWASAPAEAADALERVGAAAIERGDRTQALAALRRLRGGIYATRHVGCPFCDLGPAVDARLARLSALEQAAQGLSRGLSEEQLVAEHARLLALDPTPTTGWALAATLGFLGWIGGALGFIFRGLDTGLHLVQPAARNWTLVFAGSFGVWMVGLWQA